MKCKSHHHMYIYMMITVWILPQQSPTNWGFFAHKQINRTAVYTLPPEMFVFYEYHIDYLEENAVNPDKRRYLVASEGQRHFLDMDSYPDTLMAKMPFAYRKVEGMYDEEFLADNGTLPWSMQQMYYRLRDAFVKKDVAVILKLSAESGHYIGDANVPLHTTKNYNGQLTGQHGIHGFWESRLPELFFAEYALFTGKADYIDDPAKEIWEHILIANRAVDSVLRFEKELSEDKTGRYRKSYNKRNNNLVNEYSREYSLAYHLKLNGMVERQLRRSVKLVGDFWYTCWVDAGQPDLEGLIGRRTNEKKVKPNKNSNLRNIRGH